MNLKWAQNLVKWMCWTAVLLSLFLLPGAATIAQNEYAAQLANLFDRDSVTIVITDSGLGGLSVCAGLESRLRDSHLIRSVRLVFVNALPDLASTYNSMASVEEQARVFDDVLKGIEFTSHPDAILIACNTLSAVYPKTVFARKSALPVVSMIQVGSRMIAERTRASGNSDVVIFGTPSTISSGVYQEQLSALGIGRGRIIVQPCKLLESEIQADPKSDVVNSLVETYVDEAMEKLGYGVSGRISVGLCCSHYGYSADVFRRCLRQKAGERFDLLNPNDAMVALLDMPKGIKFVRPASTSVEVLSRVPITDQEIQSIAGALTGTSRKTANALRHYRQRDNLFPFKK